MTNPFFLPTSTEGPDFLIRRLTDLERRIDHLAAARTLEAATISEGGINVVGTAGIIVAGGSIRSDNFDGDLDAPAAGTSGYALGGPHNTLIVDDIVVRDGIIGGAALTDNTVDQSKISFTVRDIGGITTTIAATAPSDPEVGDLWYDASNGFQMNRWDGSAWVPVQFGTAAIEDGAVTGALIGPNAVTGAKIADAAITAIKIADAVITGAKIADGTIAASNVDFNASDIDGDGVIAAAQTTANDAQDAATAAGTAAATAQAAADAAQTTADGRNKIFRQATAPAAEAVGDVWFDTSSGNRVSIWDGTTWHAAQLQGVAVGNLDAGAITTGSLAAARIAAATITGDKLAADTITATQIAGAAITADEVAAEAIGTAALAAGAVTAGKIAGGTITGDKIAGGTITGDNIAASAITSDLIAANAVVAGQIAAGALDAFTINAGTLTAGSVSAGSIGDSHIVMSTLSNCDTVIDPDGGTILVYATPDPTVVNLTTPGNGSWTVPAGVTTVKVECWAGGASGDGSVAPGHGGFGGGGGEYAREDILAVTPGASIPYTVGAGGAVGRNAGTGGDTSWNNGQVLAHGGGILGGELIAGGSGSTNTVHFSGGAGHGSVGGATSGGGGGGSSAGPTRSGDDGSANNGVDGGAGGFAVAGGGAGGTGGFNNGGGGEDGFAGGIPGGGGGGAGAGTSAHNGGAGGRGQIRLTYGIRTLIASIAAVAGTDAFGNSYPAGIQGTQLTQTGSFVVNFNNQVSGISAVHNFPVAFSDVPTFVCMSDQIGGSTGLVVCQNSLTASQFSVLSRNANNQAFTGSVTVHWIAVGPR